jgi:Mrp family chromosome partitioning ATPase
MTLEQFWTVIIKRWQIILICFLVVGLGTFIGSKLMKPLYQSSALVEVVIHSSSINQTSYTDLQASDQLVQTEATLATSDPVLRVVASHYTGLTVIQLAQEVSSTTKLNTQLFEIDVVDTSPTRAADLANDVAGTLTKQQSQAAQLQNTNAQKQIQQNLDQTSQQINDVTTKISALQAKAGNQGQIALLQAQLSGYQQHYSQWQSALAQLELTQAQAQSGDILLVAQPAQPTVIPVRPNIRLYTGIGLLVGLLLGILLAMLFERLDTRVRTPEEITHLLAWPVLATIWHAGSSKTKDVINPSGHNVEPFRILRTNIGFSSLDQPLRSLVVTSAVPRDGKSSIAANLAIFIAKAGKSTLLIDADLHRPTQHTLFNLPPDKLGLSNAVLAFSMPDAPRTPIYNQFVMNTSTLQGGPSTSNISLEPFVHSVGIPNLWIMPSGPLPPNPSEFLESKVMQGFLAMIENCGIEMVIFDTPPLLGLSDASILASKVDGALIVVDTKRATKGKLRQSKAMLSQTGVHVLGCVANKLKHKRKESSYYYYYYEENQGSGEKSTRNGHNPSVPVTPTSAVSPSEQRMRSN